MNAPLKVLIIEDSESDAIVLLSLLRRGGYEPEFLLVDNANDLTAALEKEPWDIVLADHLMPGFDSRAALAIVREINPDIPFLIVSGAINDELAVSAMKAGAQDYLMKSNLSRLVVAVDRELKDAEERRARRVAERTLLAQEEEFRIAREVQQRLFPAAAPHVEGYDIAGASCPAAATGGDYFDYIPDPQGNLYVVVGDVTGHGLGPALLMADVRAYLRSQVLSNSDLVGILAQTRHLLREDLGADRFITLLFAKLDPVRRTWDYINAGHPAGYVIAADGRIKAEMHSGTSALGIDGNEERLVPGQITLEKGDLVLLLTDGVEEARSSAGAEFGEARVLEIVRRLRTRPAGEIVRAILDEARRFGEPEGIQDDMTVVVVKL
jgi:serine phosphatase RsbU (regulator of sigma subunit)